MQQYLDLMRHVLEHGASKTDRTGTGTLATFGWQMRFDLAAGFPLVTTKKLHLKSIVHELLWFLRGETNVRYLRENGVTIWDEWADARRRARAGLRRAVALVARRGRRARSTRSRPPFDLLKRDPHSRRIIVNAWNVGELDSMALTPCHALFQFYVADGRLSCQLYQRSADIFLGVPFNIASYALLTHMLAQQCDLVPGEFIWTGGDCHLYVNHLEQARLQLAREPLPLPRLELRRRPPIDLRLPLRGLRGRRLPVTSSHQGPDRRMKKSAKYRPFAVPGSHHPHMRHASRGSSRIRGGTAVRGAPFRHPRPGRVRRAVHPEGNPHHRVPRRSHHARAGR